MSARGREPWYRRVWGEISLLRTSPSVTLEGSQAYGVGAPYRLDTSRVDYAKARRLYRNTDDAYKLGAGFARPIIDALTGFVGLPAFDHPDGETAAALNEFVERWRGLLRRVHRDAMRDGDAFLRLSWEAAGPDEPLEVVATLVPPEWVRVVPDPLNVRAWRALVIRYPVHVEKEEGQVPDEYEVTETITAESIRIQVGDRAPAEVRAALEGERRNELGFIPVVHFRNEAEEHALRGASELEPLEPYFRVYHDVALMAAGGAKLFSRPKLKMRLRNVAGFLQNNFSAEERAARRLAFDQKEVFFLTAGGTGTGDGEDAEFLSADTGLQSVTAFLELVFLCIVDTAQTPEFVFGGAIASSKASVSEQMIPFSRRVDAKRDGFDEAWRQVARMVLAIGRRYRPGLGLSTDGAALRMTWPEISPRDEQSLANAVAQAVQGVTTAVDAGVMSREAGAEFLRGLVPTMLPWTDEGAAADEARRIAGDEEATARRLDRFGLGPTAAGRRDGDQDDEDGDESGDRATRGAARER